MSDFLNYWQQFPLHLDPIFLQLGSLQIRYYGLMFVLSLIVTYGLILHRQKNDNKGYSKAFVEDYFTWVVLGVLLGGRLGYVLFYNFSYYVTHLLEIFFPFDIENGFKFVGIGGMSYHGGLVGVLLATWLYCRKNEKDFWPFVDFIVPCVPAGYFFGRIGNFLNGELFGRVTTAPWGMYFGSSIEQLRHPSQLYEAFFEGLVLFLILWQLKDKKFFSGFLFCVYLAGYGVVRFLIEFTREPDAHLGFVLGVFSMGQVLCIAMIVIAGLIAIYLKKQQEQK